MKYTAALLSTKGFIMVSMKLYFFPRVILYNFSYFWLIFGGLGFGVLRLGSYIGFLGLGFSVDGVWGL